MPSSSIYTKKKIFRASGAFLALFSIMLFLSPFGAFWGIGYGIVFSLGFAGFWLLIPSLILLGILMLVKGELKRLLNAHFLFGYLFLYFGMSLLFGLIASGGGTAIDGTIEAFHAVRDGNKPTSALVLDDAFSGGVPFTWLASLINNAGFALSIVVVSVLLLAALFLILYRPLWRKLILLALKKSGQKSAIASSKRQAEANMKESEEVYEYSPLSEMEPVGGESGFYDGYSPLEEQVEEFRPSEEERPAPSRSAHNDDPTYVPPVFEEPPFSEPSLSVPSASEPTAPVFDLDIGDIPSSAESQDETPAIRSTPSFNEVELGEETPVSSVIDKKEETPVPSFAFSTEKPWQPSPSSGFVSPSHSDNPSDAVKEEEETKRQSFGEERPMASYEEPIDERKPAEAASKEASETFVSPFVAEPLAEAPSGEPSTPPEPKDDASKSTTSSIEEPSFADEENEESEEKADDFDDFKPMSEREKMFQALHQPKEFAYPPYEMPPLSLLNDPKPSEAAAKNKTACETNVAILNQAFSDLHVGAKVIGYTIGPSVTRYDILPDASSSVKSIERVIPDLSQRLRGTAARFSDLIRGKNTSGLEVPNEKTETVTFKEVFSALPSGDGKNMYIPFGKNIDGEIVSGDLSDFPHMIVSGTTGSGKSVYAHSVLLSLIMRNRPEDLKLVLVDPKKVEMTNYAELPHLLCPIITDPGQAKVCLDKLIVEMERRYEVFSFFKVRNIRSFNEGIAAKEHLAKLPFIVCFIDEFADLVDTCKNIQEPVVRIAQKARAAGIHLIIATQRPTVQVISGTIKANMPCRVALSMSSAQDSITILSQGGAEDLIGHGDMLVSCDKVSRFGLVRAQGCFAPDAEINAVTDFIRAQMKPCYDPLFLDLTDHEAQQNEASSAPQIDKSALKAASDAELYDSVKTFVYTQEYTSISKLQRQFSIGFGRAGKIIKKLQDDGIVALQPDTPQSAKGVRVLVHQSSESSSSTELMGDNL